MNKLTVFDPVKFSFFLIHLENNKTWLSIFAMFVQMYSKVNSVNMATLIYKAYTTYLYGQG